MCEAFPYVVSNHVYAGRIFVKHLCVCVSYRVMACQI